MDHFIVVHHDKKHLQQLKEEIRGLLKNQLRLELNPKGTMIGRTGDGIDFVGYRVYADRVRIKKASIKRMKKRLKVMQAMYRKGTASIWKISHRVRSWLGHCCHADAGALVQNILAGAVFTKG